MRKPSFGRKSRRNNPFEQTAAEAAGATATGSADDGATHTEAVAVLGEPLVSTLGAVVAATPGLLSATASAVRPDDVEESTITLVGIVLDTSLSARRLQPLLGEAHDTFVNALRPAQREGVQILVTCSTLDGRVVYPLTRIQNVLPFGRPATGTVHEEARDNKPVKVDELGRLVANNGMTYDHMIGYFQLINYTPIRDRIKEQVTAMLAEMVQWDNPRIARTVNVVSMAITDGLPVRDGTTVQDLSEFIEEVEQGGFFTEVAMLIADIASPKFREELMLNIISNLVPYEQRSHLMPDQLRQQFGHLLPEGHEDWTTERLIRWWFYAQGLAATDDRFWLPGTDPKAIRNATGQMSQVAFQASTSAFREDES